MRTTSAAGRLPIAATLGCAAAAVLAGCSVVQAPSASRHSDPPVRARVVSASGNTPKQRAEADVAAIVKRFVKPSGASEVSSAPVAVLKNATPPRPASPDVATKTTWWVAPGDPRKVLAWEASHLPKLFHLYGTGTASTGVWDDDFSLPNVKGVLISRDLSVAVTADGQGKTAIRVDAVAQWLPARTPADMLPKGVRVVTISQHLGLNAHGKKPPEPATISDTKEVAKIVALINAQPLFPPGAYNCPMDDGQSVTMRFRAKAGGPVIAVATLETSGCTGIDITVGGKQKPSRGPGVGWTVTVQALKIAGLHWKLPALS
jgi:hypothetical protein